MKKVYLIKKLWFDILENRNSYGYTPEFIVATKEQAEWYRKTDGTFFTAVKTDEPSGYEEALEKVYRNGAIFRYQSLKDIREEALKA